MKSAIGAIVLGISAFFSGAAAAETYAAISYSQETGAYGYANRYDTQDGAEERAAQECGPSCETVIWARDACAALFIGNGNGYGVGWSADEDETVRIASEECSAQTSDCGLKAMVCSAY